MAEKLEQGWVGRVSEVEGLMFVYRARFFGGERGWAMTPHKSIASVFITEEDAKRATQECVEQCGTRGLVALFPVRGGGTGDGEKRWRWSSDEGWMSYDLHLEEA